MNSGKSVALHPFRPVLNFSALQRDVIRMAAFMIMTALAADSRPRRFENTISTSRRCAPGPSRANSYNIQNFDQ